jgi:isoleucyl-tRNA synthetase
MGTNRHSRADFDPTKEAETLELMIWTTTPWTLPANRAVAVHPEYEYAKVHFRDASGWAHDVIVAKKLVEKVMAVAGVTDYVVRTVVTGADWVSRNPTYTHPLDPAREQPVVLADYVTLEDGTGLVHTAPGHGKEDYQTGIKYGLEVYNPVLADGRYDETVPAFLQGQTIWDANKMVLDRLKESGALFHAQEFAHEYPHCWRCKKPVIFRATEQWFVKASAEEAPTRPPSPTARANVHAPTETAPTHQTPPPTQSSVLSPQSSLWSNAKNFVNSVSWVPAWGKNRIDGMLDTRPDWCISRQRSWGVPIPAFFDDKGNLLLTEKTVRKIAAYFREHGADSWYTHTPAQLLGADTWTDTVITPGGKTLSEFSLQTSTLSKGSDILDVWFESGASHHAVLECTHPELGYPAQMYLEGSDQHRGWFQSSLLEASGYKPVPPFKEVLTHGFVVDEKGRKMSKSEGNDIKVEAALKQYGADVLRLWVSSVDYQNDIPCGPNLLRNTGEAYRKIRNTMKYLLGNLYDFNPATDSVEPRPHSIDAWMMSKVATWAADIRAAYNRYEFHTVFKLIYEFCNVEISAVYAKAIKDRLYCELPNSPKRRTSQTVCYRALLHLIEACAPILVFTAEEAWMCVKQLAGGETLPPSVHLQILDDADGAAPVSEAVVTWDDHIGPQIILANQQLDNLKRTVGLGNPLDAEAVIRVPLDHHLFPAKDQYGQEIEDVLGVGFHRVISAPKGSDFKIEIRDTRDDPTYRSCARSWKRRPDVGSDKDFPDLSARDAAVVRALRAKG